MKKIQLKIGLIALKIILIFALFGSCQSDQIQLPTTQSTCIEEFDFYGQGQTEFPAYVNYSQTGQVPWKVKSFYYNQYLECSAYATGQKVCSVFGVYLPNKAEGISFKTKDGYNNGATTKVYFSPEKPQKVSDESFPPSSWVDLSEFFVISSGNKSGYGSKFVISGDFYLSEINQAEGWIVFVYRGEDKKITTTMQIDQIQLLSDSLCK
ncbi:MAG: hypothetical protein C4K58_00855 [Flavobacteriaceae bacterium]|nr:MAG: hypothetical protein C4K58_00855 [Flavobacteriaceae bacterium]